jgi:peroxiredoxin (alkyl hydroperoxide reductase subunit C)
MALKTRTIQRGDAGRDWRPRGRRDRPDGGIVRGREGTHGGKDDMTCHDWFFCTKKLEKDVVMGKIQKK